MQERKWIRNRKKERIIEDMEGEEIEWGEKGKEKAEGYVEEEMLMIRKEKMEFNEG
jgi:hypothetical protein